jgi:hypothetical protein
MLLLLENVKMKEIKYTVLYCVCEITISEPLLITVPVPLRSVIKLRFQFRYGKKLYGSGSATLISPPCWQVGCGVAVGAQLAVQMSVFLEEWEIYSADEEDDDD